MSKFIDMDKIPPTTVVLTSLSVEDLQTVIIDCVNSCLINNKRLENFPQQVDKWFNLEELRQYLPDKPSKATIYSWVSEGIIPVHKSQKRLRFLQSEIDAWLKQGKRKTHFEFQAEAYSYLNSKAKGGKR